MATGQSGGNITHCAAITQNGVLQSHAYMGPYNTALILTFLDQLHNITAANQVDHMQYIVVWDNVSFHRSALVQNWFQQHPHFTCSISSTILSIPQPYRIVFLGMAVEGI